MSSSECLAGLMFAGLSTLALCSAETFFALETKAFALVTFAEPLAAVLSLVSLPAVFLAPEDKTEDFLGHLS